MVCLHWGQFWWCGEVKAEGCSVLQNVGGGTFILPRIHSSEEVSWTSACSRQFSDFSCASIGAMPASDFISSSFCSGIHCSRVVAHQNSFLAGLRLDVLLFLSPSSSLLTRPARIPRRAPRKRPSAPHTGIHKTAATMEMHLHLP